MGVCLAVVKIIGVGSLGILTGQLINQSCQTIPLLESVSSATNIKEHVNNLIAKTSCSLVSLGGLASVLFTMAFFKAPQRYRHPYLLYAAAGAPLASATLLCAKPYMSFIFGQLHSVARCVCSTVSSSSGCTRSSKCCKSTEEKQPEKAEEEEEPSSLDSSVYLHIEKEDDKPVTSPAASVTSNCKPASCCKSETCSLADLKTLKYAYSAASTIVGLSFLISTIGIYGDF